MPVILREEENPIMANLNKNVNMIGNVVLQKKIKEQEEKRALQDVVKKAIITAAMSGKIKQREGADLTGLENLDLEGAGFGKTLGRLGGAFEPVTKYAQPKIPKVTSKDIEEMGKTVTEEVEEEYQPPPYLGGIPGFLEKYMPFGGKARQRRMEEQKQQEIGRRMTPILGRQKSQFLGQPATQSVTDTSGLPDPSDYTEGTIYEDDDGTQYKIENGEWVEL